MPEAVQAHIMRAGIVDNVTPADRYRLEAIIGDRNAPQKHIWHAKLILATADGCGTAEIIRRSSKVKPVVRRWHTRFMAEGVAGLIATRRANLASRRCRRPPCSGSWTSRSVRRQKKPPTGTGRMLAKVGGMSSRSVQRILESPSTRAPRHPHTQAVERSEVRGQTQGHCPLNSNGIAIKLAYSIRRLMR